VRFLILGGAGMLGHKLYQELKGRGETYVTVRRPASAYARLDLFQPGRVIDGVDATDSEDLQRALAKARPNVVFNAVGIIKQLKEAHDPVVSIKINALLPHQLAEACAAANARFIHVSTDCVFSGRKGSYTEEDAPDPVDLYGRSKLLGEVDAPGSVTVRTSMIGREIETQAGLVEWFLSQRSGRVKGFQKAIYTGFTTLELARILADIAEKQPDLQGVWQVSSDPIDKYALLGLVDDAYDLGVTIDPETEFVCDRSMDSTRFRERTGYRPPAWPEMINEMRRDPTPYDKWRNR
jgi:dTDP-4-dehydrorhamnose reductase